MKDEDLQISLLFIITVRNEPTVSETVKVFGGFKEEKPSCVPPTNLLTDRRLLCLDYYFGQTIVLGHSGCPDVGGGSVRLA